MAVLGLELPLLLVLAGVGLMILEALSPTEYFMIVGVALLLAGLVGTVATPLATPLALAAMTLVFGAITFYVYSQFDLYGDGSAGQTRDSSSLRGATGTVVERVTGSEGRVKLEDGGFNPYYQARAIDGEIPEGEAVIVLDPGGGNVLTVTSREEANRDEIDRELEREARRARERDGSESTGTSSESTGTSSSEDASGTPAGGGGTTDEPSEPSGDEDANESRETDLESERSG